jgi:hypothetical protein
VKALFLDVDGVLNSTRSTLARGGPIMSPLATLSLDLLNAAYKEDLSVPYGPKYTIETIDPTAVALVNRLLKKSQAKLIISSSHRAYLCDNGIAFKSAEHMRRLQLYFNILGLEYEIHDVTEKLYIERGAEVQKYLDDNLEIERYTILDDADDFRADQNLVRCDPQIGFSAENYYLACRHLLVHESTIIY